MAILGRCFVSGGAGFIGSHLVDRLVAQGNSVTVYDNLSSGRREWLEQHRGDDRVRLVVADLLDAAALREAMAGHDLVFHLGANTDIPGGHRQTDLDLYNCTVATHNILEAMRASGPDRILFASSATVYGDASARPVAETAGPLLPISLYGAAKLSCEALISAYCHLFGFRAWVFRFANVVGTRMGHGVILDFIRKLRADPNELEVLGDGKQEKPFFLVEECLDGMLCAFHNGKLPCDIYNLGCSTTTTVDTIARIVQEEMGLAGVRLRYTGGQRGFPGDAPQVRFDLTKMKRLGWEARHTSDEAVRIATRRLLQKAREPAAASAEQKRP